MAAWCIAKMICLVGPVPCPPKCSIYKDELDLAAKLAVEYNPKQWKIVNSCHWRTELNGNQNPPVSTPLLDFIESLLVIDPEKRPTASQALQYPYFEIASDEEVECEPFVFPSGDGPSKVYCVDGITLELHSAN